MLKEILSQINWVDVLSICILLRCIWKGAAKGIFIEFFKLLGMFFAIFFSIHYYLKLAVILRDRGHVPVSICEIAAFVLIWIVTLIVFNGIRSLVSLWISGEELNFLSRFGGVLLGALRSVLVAGLTIILLLVPGKEMLSKNVQNSYSGWRLSQVPLQIYSFGFENIVKTYFPLEQNAMDSLHSSSRQRDRKQP